MLPCVCKKWQNSTHKMKQLHYTFIEHFALIGIVCLSCLNITGTEPITPHITAVATMTTTTTKGRLASNLRNPFELVWRIILQLYKPVWPDGKIIFQYLTFISMKILSILIIKIAKSRFKCGQILNKPSKICPRLLKLCQCGEISPNLVTRVQANATRQQQSMRFT